MDYLNNIYKNFYCFIPFKNVFLNYINLIFEPNHFDHSDNDIEKNIGVDNYFLNHEDFCAINLAYGNTNCVEYENVNNTFNNLNHILKYKKKHPKKYESDCKNIYKSVCDHLYGIKHGDNYLNSNKYECDWGWFILIDENTIIDC